MLKSGVSTRILHGPGERRTDNRFPNDAVEIVEMTS